MSDTNNVNGSFVQLAGLIIAGGFIASASGGPSVFLALITCYFMLVVANGIRRGENKAKRQRTAQQSQHLSSNRPA
jgi:hypothetical protein